jgi:DNA-binding SARP family transcriptional activator
LATLRCRYSRERLRSQYLELLDLLIAESERRDDIDEAVRLLQRAIATEPHDEARYLRLAQLLSTQGRAGSALATPPSALGADPPV